MEIKDGPNKKERLVFNTKSQKPSSDIIVKKQHANSMKHQKSITAADH